MYKSQPLPSQSCGILNPYTRCADCNAPLTGLGRQHYKLARGLYPQDPFHRVRVWMSDIYSRQVSMYRSSLTANIPLHNLFIYLFIYLARIKKKISLAQIFTWKNAHPPIIRDKLAYVSSSLTADFPLHECAPKKNAQPPKRCDFLDDVMSQSELKTTEAFNYKWCYSMHI